MRRTLYVAAVLISLAAATTARAQTGAALLLKPLMAEDETLESSGEALFLMSPQAEGADFDLSIYELRGRVREHREQYIPRIGWDMAFYNMRSDVPVLDQNLIDTSVAVAMEVGPYSDWKGGLSVGVGYAGNSPFGESDAYYAKSTLVLGKKMGEKTNLAFVLDYDGNRTIYPDVPLPGIAYVRQYDEHISFTLGVPLTSVTWRPNEATMIEVTWQLVDQVDARIEHKLAGDLTVFGNFERRQEAFSVDGLSRNDRLLFEQRRIEAGIRWQPWEHTSFTAAGGYAFSSDFSIGFDQRKSDKVADVSDEPYVRVGFERRW
jgi:hypothetical protein